MFKVLISTLLLSFTAFAQDNQNREIKGGGLFVEPALTYETGTLTVRYPVPFTSDSKENVKGYGLGLRVGGHVADIFLLAADVRYSQPDYESTVLNGSALAKALNYGATVGIQTPFLGIRIWNTFILDGNLDPDKINGINIKHTGFNGYRLGAGLYVAVVSVNLEYQEANYKDFSVESFGFGSVSGVEGKQKSYILSVSFPIAM